jgi:hypothetical protein
VAPSKDHASGERPLALGASSSWATTAWDLLAPALVADAERCLLTFRARATWPKSMVTPVERIDRASEVTRGMV